MDVTLGAAHRIAQDYLDGCFPPDDPVALFSDNTAEDHGWCYLFHYNRKQYLESQDSRDALPPGPGPVVVVKSNGTAWMMRSSDFEGQLSRYAREHGYS